MLPYLSGVATNRIQNPTGDIENLRLQARDKVNADFSGVGDTLAQRYLATGGQSGKFGSAVRGVDLARRGALGGVEGKFAQLAYDNKNEGVSLAERLLALARGSSSEGSGTTPNMGLSGALDNGLETVTLLQTLNRMLKSGGGGFGSGVNGASDGGVQLP